MPRLIKLASSQENKADFQNFFTEDIVIKPNAKVALYSLSLTLNDRVFEVNDANSSFQVQNIGLPGSGGRGGLKPVSLRTGEYNKASFLIELTRAINSAFALDGGASNGRVHNEWKPVYDTTNKLNIQYNATMDDSDANIKMQLGTFAFAGNNFQKAGADNTWQSAYMTELFQNGVGNILCNIDANNGTCIGLINDTTNGLTLAPQNYFACVFIDNNVYKYYYNGVTSVSAIIPAANDFMSIVLELGELKFWGGGILLGRVAYTYDKQLHGAVSSYMNANVISNLTYSPTPYQNTNATGISVVQRNNEIQDHENYMMFDNVGAPATVGGIHALVLTNASAALLGFLTLNMTHLNAVFGEFDGVRSLNFSDLANNLTIEIPSLDLYGYDGEVHRRRNILSILPADDAAEVQRFYQAIYPIYIDINNRNEQLLNTIQIRILDEAGIPVNIKPLPGVILTILLD